MKKIMIIKLGAKGDVIRTMSILPALKIVFPDSKIIWITKKDSVSIISENPYINKIYSTPFSTEEKFDLLYNFDLDDEAMDLAKNTNADKKFGFYLEADFPTVFNKGALYYLNTFFDDELKKNNRKTYQQMMFDLAEISYNKEHCPIYLNKQDHTYANNFLKENNIDDEKSKKLIGIHIGYSERWPSRSWPIDKVKQFIIEAKNKNYEIILFGGPNEKEKHKRIINELKEQGVRIFHNNIDNTDREFSSLINICNKIISSDSYAMHVSLALKKPTIALFFCTSPHEIEGYGLLKKIISPMQESFFPEKMDQYSEDLVNSIPTTRVLEALNDNDVKLSRIRKIKRLEELIQIINNIKDEKTIVFTSGCFDIIHLGHIDSLENAKSLGDILIVGLNTDNSVKRLKGNLRPIKPEDERLQIISSLESVDYVTLFDEENPGRMLEKLKPHIYVKGADYNPNDFNSMPEAKIVKEYGGKIIILPILKGYSTTDIIKKINMSNNE